MFENCKAPQPWWYIQNNEHRKIAIDNYHLNNQLQETLDNNQVHKWKIKI